tara:strand:- start:199 stop:474 length:276 start_codon:yes stop_codon:yes gene_type:complete
MWTWLVLAIAGSIVGGATDSWFRDTKMGIWFYAKMDNVYTWANNRYGLKILTDEKERLKKFPALSKRIVELEQRINDLEHLVEYVESNKHG